MSDFDIEQQRVFLKTIGRFVSDQIRKAVEPLKERIAELEMTGIKFVGTYQRAAQYVRGDVVNHDGGMWVCTCDTPPQEVPGKSVCWQLSVKSSNGKDHDAPRQPTRGGARPQTTIERRT
jgi:hypothetical protein